MWFQSKYAVQPLSLKALSVLIRNAEGSIKTLERLLGWIYSCSHYTVHFLTNPCLPLFSSKVQWFLLKKLHLETKHFFFFCKFLVRSLQEMSKFVVLFPRATFAIFITQPLRLWSRIGSRVKISHYIQPSNLCI